MVEDIEYPSTEEVGRLYARIIKATGGEHGYLSKGNLEYILDTVKDVGERVPRRQAIIKKAAFLLYNVVVIHPFVNGNKRAGFELVRLFLAANGYALAGRSNSQYALLLDIASGRVSAAEVESWLGRHLTELKEKKD